MKDKGLVVVTGASGFVASWLVKRLLEDGYRVRGTVRDPNSEKKVAHLRALPGATERLELVRANLLVPGSFDAAVDGVDGVFHTASPVIDNAKATDPVKELIEPAVKGALNLLTSVAKSKSVKRVVLTSSTAAVRNGPGADGSIDESFWSSIPVCEQMKAWYPLAKTTAEAEAWKFAKEHGIDLVTILPSVIVGYVLPPEISETSKDVLRFLKGESDGFFLVGRRMGFVHLDDVARGHILCYETPEAEGRYLCDGGVLDPKDMSERIAKLYPQYPIYVFEVQPNLHYTYETSKLKKLGLERCKPLEEMFEDALSSLKDKGLM